MNSNFLHRFLVSLALIVFFAASFSYGFSKTFIHQQTGAKDLKVKPVELVDKWPSSMKRWAIIIGVDEYDDKNVGQLRGAVNDARMLAKVLEKNAGFPANHIILLTSDQTGEHRSTRANILREMSDLASVVPKDGLLLIAFSGHGIERYPRIYLLPSDSQVKALALLEETSVPATLIADWFRAKAQHIVILIDACRSYPIGGGLLLPIPRGASLRYLKDEFWNRQMDEQNKDITAFAILYATESGHEAYEDTKRQQGFLTGTVVKALEGDAANDEGDITLAGLIKYVQKRVPKMSKEQTGIEQRPIYFMEGYKPEELVIAVAKRQ